MFSSMYPYIVIVFNIERNTMYGKLYIHEFTDERYDHLFIDDTITDISSDDDSDDEIEYDPEYDAGKDFMDNYLSGDVISLGTKWFNLPDFTEINRQFVNKFGVNKVSHGNIELKELSEPYVIKIDE